VGGSVQRRIHGLRLVADDLDWSWGQGPEVHGSAEALILMLTGRPVGAEELTGPGAVTLYDRL
ncbi:MAG: maleylpyruvate isomerase family mycothiol-dependent enzyme, partial [Pseudonocardia sp.]